MTTLDTTLVPKVQDVIASVGVDYTIQRDGVWDGSAFTEPTMSVDGSFSASTVEQDVKGTPLFSDEKAYRGSTQEIDRSFNILFAGADLTWYPIVGSKVVHSTVTYSVVLVEEIRSGDSVAAIQVVLGV